MRFDEAYGVTALSIYPVANSLNLLAFPTGDPRGQCQRLNYILPGFLRAGPLLIPKAREILSPSTTPMTQMQLQAWSLTYRSLSA